MSDAGTSCIQQHGLSGYVRYVIATLFVVNVLNYMDRMAVAALAPVIKADLHLSDSQLGLLIGFAFALCYALCGIPIARWADRGIRRNVISVTLLVWSGMTALSGTAQNFWHLFLARIGVGAGEAGGLPSAQSILCDYVPLNRRSGVFAVHTCGLYVGMMLGIASAGWLGEKIGWRFTLMVLGLPGIAVALLVFLTIREPTRGSFDAVNSDGAQLALSATMRILWRCRTYRLLMLFCVVNGFVQYGLNQWWPSYYTRTFGLELSSIGIGLGVAMGLGSGAGLLIGGKLADRYGQRDLRLPLVVGAFSTLLAIPAALASLFVLSVSTSLILVFVTGMLWSVSIGPATATFFSVVTPRMRATAGAFVTFFTSLLGLGLGPLCVGILSDFLAPWFGTDALRYALIAPTCFLPVMAVALFKAAGALPGDLKMLRDTCQSGRVARSVDVISEAQASASGAGEKRKEGESPVGLASRI